MFCKYSYSTDWVHGDSKRVPTEQQTGAIGKNTQNSVKWFWQRLLGMQVAMPRWWRKHCQDKPSSTTASYTISVLLLCFVMCSRRVRVSIENCLWQKWHSKQFMIWWRQSNRSKQASSRMCGDGLCCWAFAIPEGISLFANPWQGQGSNQSCKPKSRTKNHELKPGTKTVLPKAQAKLASHWVKPKWRAQDSSQTGKPNSHDCQPKARAKLTSPSPKPNWRPTNSSQNCEPKFQARLVNPSFVGVWAILVARWRSRPRAGDSPLSQEGLVKIPKFIKCTLYLSIISTICI